MTITAAEFRQHFPMLAASTHLASCSQAARSNQVDASLTRMLDSMATKGAPWGDWMTEAEGARTDFARFIGADPDEVAIVPNASIGAYQVVSSLDLGTRSEILSNEMEFPSVGNVWHAQQARGATVTMVPERDGTVPLEDIIAGLSERTALVSAPLVTYRNGARIYAPELAERARELGVPTFVDAYQGAGVLPIDVGELDCDFLVAGTLKYLLGLPGLAFLYVRGGVSTPLAPSLTGWFGRADPFAFDPVDISTPSTARRFETGTPAVPSVYAARAGFELLGMLDQQAVWEHVSALREQLRQGLAELGADFSEPAESARGPLVAVRVPDPDRLAANLLERGIFTSPRGDLLRLSLHYYNTGEDVEQLLSTWKTVVPG